MKEFKEGYETFKVWHNHKLNILFHFLTSLIQIFFVRNLQVAGGKGTTNNAPSIPESHNWPSCTTGLHQRGRFR